MRRLWPLEENGANFSRSVSFVTMLFLGIFIGTILKSLLIKANEVIGNHRGLSDEMRKSFDTMSSFP